MSEEEENNLSMVTMPESLKNRSNAYLSYAMVDLRSAQIENIVTEFRDHLGIEIDWGYVAGRPIIHWMPRTPEVRKNKKPLAREGEEA